MPNTFDNFLLFAFLSLTLANLTSNESSRWKTIQQKDVEGLVMKYLPTLLENALIDSRSSKSKLSANKSYPPASESELLPRDLNVEHSQGRILENLEIDANSELAEKIANMLETSIRRNQQLDDVPFQSISSRNKYDLDMRKQNLIDQKRDETLGNSLPPLSDNIRRLIPKLARKLSKVIVMKDSQHRQDFPSLNEQDNRRAAPTLTSQPSPDMSGISLECLSSCDVFNEKSKACWFDRQVGDTITFSVRVRGVKPEHWKEGKIILQWERKHLIRASDNYVIEKLFPETTLNNSRNIMVGSGGLRLRISPIQDTDMDFNYFIVSANAISPSSAQKQIKISEITFKVDILPIDMGFVYLGEEITIDIRNYITLPENVYHFEWRMEKSFFTSLPPNMRVVNRGQILFITELSKEQDGIVVCSMYTKDDLFLAKRRFRIRIPVLPTFLMEKNPKSNTSTIEDEDSQSPSTLN